MSRFVTIPLGKIPAAFERAGFTEKETIDIVTGLVYLWKYNYLYEEITDEFILTELDLEPLAARVFLLEAGGYLNQVGEYVRHYVGQGRIMSWNVRPFLIRLELENEHIHPLSQSTSIDGCAGDDGSLPRLV